MFQKTKKKERVMKIFRAEQSRTSFTLIELLIVISIIAVLTAMLLPALRKARESAQGIACLNHFSSLGKAATFYSDDYSDYILSVYAAGGSYSGVNWTNEAWYVSRTLRDYLQMRDSAPIGGASGQNKNKLYCPSAPAPIGSAGTYTASYTIGINNLIRYCSTTYPNGIKRAFLRQPSRGFYFGDNSAFEGGGVYIHPDPTLKDRPGFRHANACNALFFDGHASRVSSGKFPLKSMNAQAENTSFWKNWAPKDWNAEAEKIFAH